MFMCVFGRIVIHLSSSGSILIMSKRLDFSSRNKSVSEKYGAFFGVTLTKARASRFTHTLSYNGSSQKLHLMITIAWPLSVPQ